MMKKLCYLPILLSFLFCSGAKADIEIKDFQKNVLRHVLMHELAHALIREFDIPILGNEETAADVFATFVIAEEFPNSAQQIISDRTKAWILQSNENLWEDDLYLREHNSKKRRAYQVICLFYGVSGQQIFDFPKWGNFPNDQMKNCKDFAPELQRGWRRSLASLKMPVGSLSNEVRIIYGEGPWKQAMKSSGILERFSDFVKTFDWHSLITIHFDHCDQGVYWRRSSRTILVCDNNIEQLQKLNISSEKK